MKGKQYLQHYPRGVEEGNMGKKIKEKNKNKGEEIHQGGKK
jgi:hypothetical protein